MLSKVDYESKQVLDSVVKQASDLLLALIKGEDFARVEEKLNRILAENTGKSYEQLCVDADRDNFMTAEEALNYGLIDKIMTKRN